MRPHYFGAFYLFLDYLSLHDRQVPGSNPSLQQ